MTGKNEWYVIRIRKSDSFDDMPHVKIGRKEGNKDVDGPLFTNGGDIHWFKSFTQAKRYAVSYMASEFKRILLPFQKEVTRIRKFKKSDAKQV